ncbi:MAG: ribonuclease P protein component [Bacteroidota bacterium]
MILRLTNFNFTREERLKSKKMLGALFKGGNSFVAYPLRVVWLPAEAVQSAPQAFVQVAISVPKRNFKTAVERNLLKRRIREAYRLNKQDLLEKIHPSGKPVALMIMYIAKEALTFAEIQAGVLKMIRKFPAEMPAGNQR